MPLLFTLQVGFGNYQPTRIKLSPDDGLKKENIEEESEAIEWWELKQEPEENDSDTLQVCFDDDILLKPDIRYCFYSATGVFPATGVEAKAYSRAASDKGSGSEDSGTPDKNDENCSNEDEANADSNVQYVTTTLYPFPVSNEISQYYTTMVLKKIKKEPVSDSKMPTESEGDETEPHSVNHQEIPSPSYNSDQAGRLKMHEQIHLPVNQRPKVHQCDHEGCDYSTGRTSNLKRHKQTHLPADQRPKVHQCDHEGCNYRTDQPHALKRHKQIHPFTDQRPKRKAYDQPPSNEKRKKVDKE